MELVVVRHGKAAHNLGEEEKHTFAGSMIDNGLAQEGIANAELLASNIIKMGRIDLIAASPLKRSFQTAEIIRKKLAEKNLSPEVIVIPELREINIGEFVGHTEAEVKKLYPEAADAFYNGEIEKWQFPQGENYSLAEERIRNLMAKIKRKASPGSRVLIVGHGMINRIIFFDFLPDREDLWKERSYPHDRIVSFSI